MAKTIYTVLYDDVLEGSKGITMDNCVCQLFDIKRNYDSLIHDDSVDLSKPALYILLNREERKAYIGETDDFRQRIASHTAKKEFWDEALAFMANDNSLTTTEVRYLESLSYETASNANSYDLSENTQIPKKPFVQKIQEYKIKDFFKYVTFLTRFVGCDLFEKNCISKQVFQPVHKPIKLDSDVKAEDWKGRLSFRLNGTVYKKMGLLGYAIVKEYLRSYPHATFKELKDKFSDELLGSWKSFGPLLEDDIEFARNLKVETGQYRHSIKKDDFILTSGDGFRFVVSNQWEKANVPNLLQIAKEEGWSCEKI